MPTVRNNLFAALVVALSATTAHAITADELAEQQRERDAAQAQADIAVARATAAKARLGTLDTSGLPKGTGDATNLNVEAKIVAYRAVDAAAGRIVDRIAALDPKPAAIVVFGAGELNAVLQFRAFVQQGAVIDRTVAAVTDGASGSPSLPTLASDLPCNGPSVHAAPPPSTGAGGGVIPALTGIDTALQVLSLFKTDRKIVGIDVDADEVALAADVVDRLLGRNIAAIYPPSFVPGAFGVGSAPSTVLRRYDALTAHSNALDELTALIDARRDAIGKLAATGGTSPDCKALYARDVATLDRLQAKAEAQKTAIDQLSAALIKVDDKTGLSVLQSLVGGEALATYFKSAPYALQLKPIAGGGATLAKTNLLGTKFFFSGGAVITYLLMKGDTSELVMAGTVPAYGGLVAASELSTLP